MQVTKSFEIAKTSKRAELVERLRALRGTIPSDFKFDRADANERQITNESRHDITRPTEPRDHR